MKERAVCCYDHEVRAILAGRLSQLWRPMKDQPDGDPIRDPSDGAWYVNGGFWCRRCPFGVVGDRISVREAYGGDNLCGYVYRADHPNADLRRGDLDDGEQSIRQWRSPVTMPRGLSRITLEVTGVRAMRVRSMTEDDAQACGVEWFGSALGAAERWWAETFQKAPWGINPWAWAATVRRVR